MSDAIVVLRIAVRKGVNEGDFAGCIRMANNTHRFVDLLRPGRLSIGTNMAVLHIYQLHW